VLLEHERGVVESQDFEGLVLRYGQFYGPGTYLARDGHIGREVRRRRFPIVGTGTGTFSFIHVEDAAAATVAALDRGAPGIHNVTDDEPAPVSDWLPAYAEALGARPPWRAPAWLVRLVAGKSVAETVLGFRGASNTKAKRELGWQPRHASWRQGFREALG
jgi:nucleoside-diphosphate-sugar epimerase